MMGIPTYLPLEELGFSLAQDERSYATRLEEFFVKLCATARSSTSQVGTPRAFVAQGFSAEAPVAGTKILRDSFETHDLEAFQHRNHGNHSFGDPAQVMSAWLTFVSHADIMKGCLFNLLFFQYLAPGSTLVCVQYGRSGNQPVPAGLEAVARHFAWPHDTPTVKFLRVDRQWQSQVQP